MKQDKVIEVIRELFKQMLMLTERVNGSFDKQDVFELKMELRLFKSFLGLLRMHVENDSLQIPDKIKKLYNVVGGICKLQSDIMILAEDLPENIETITGLNKQIVIYQSEWSKYYSSKIFQKLENKMLNLNYENVPTVALTNFFNVGNEDHEEYTRVKEHTENNNHIIRQMVRDIIEFTEAGKKNKILREEIKAV